MPAPRAAPLAVVAALALAACGDTLVDHQADLRQGPGANLCDIGQVACHVDGADVCKAESATFCGEACADCTASVVPPAGAVAACLGTPGLGLCGYECTGGLLKCTGGCCEATAISAGAAHTCAVAGGALYCWGDNGAGQITGVVGGAVPLPSKRVAAGVVAVAAGEAHTCAARQDDVVCFGRNEEGQATPPFVPLQGVTALAAGLRHTCALLDTGAVRCWGSGPGAGGGSPVLPAPANALAAGADHTCARLSGGEVVCWGANDSGQLGDGSTAPSATPVRAIPAGTAGAEVITARGNHSCAALLFENNGQSTLLCWGDQPGPTFGLAQAQTTPAGPQDGSRPVTDRKLQRVAAGRTHVCIQRSGAETVQCFGSENALGQLGNVVLPPPASPTEAVDVPGTIGAVALAAGGDHACAILPTTGGIRCWGSNASGQLGDGTTTTPGVGGDARPLGTPVLVSGR